jgi:tetratricopeptide (TPR) repeat protein
MAMNKQIILAIAALLLTTSLFFFGRTVAKKDKTIATVATSKNTTPAFDITRFITDEKQKLTASQLLTLGKLQNSVTRGDVLTQQINANNQLAAFWKDSIRSFEPYVYYLSAAAKLDNSEKNLTFAAQLILDNLRGEQDEAKLNWKTAQAIQLFEQAIQLNPQSDDLKIGLGSCYIFGKGRTAKPEETMKGIQQLLAVVKKDSGNMKAQLVLGIGGALSGQYDKAIDRLTKVVKAQPDNLEAVAYLADAYASKGDKLNAIKWYQVMKRMANSPVYTKEIDERIKLLQ